MTHASKCELDCNRRIQASRRTRTSLFVAALALCVGALSACGEDESITGLGREWDDRQSGGAGGTAGVTAPRLPNLVNTIGASGSGSGGSGAADAGSEVEPEAASDAGSDGSSGGTGGAPDAAPDGPPVCGDGYRDPSTEECDDGSATSGDSCDETCRVREVLVGPNVPVAPPLSPPGRILGQGRHTLAAGDSGFAVVFVEYQQSPVAVKLRSYSTHGAAAASALEVNGTAKAIESSDPVVAPLPGGKYAVAWTDLDGDGNGRGIALRVIDPASATQAPLAFANARSYSGQQRPDILATDSEMVVAWTDDSSSSGFGDIRYRRFSSTGTALTAVDETLAETTAIEDNVSLARFAGSWAAAWAVAEGGKHWVRARAAGLDWSIGPVRFASAADRVALAEIDTKRIFVAFIALVPATATTPETPALHWAVLDTEAPGAATWAVLEPKLEPYSLESIPQRQPNVVRIGNSLYVSWASERVLANVWDDEIWLKRIDIVPNGAAVTLDLSAVETALPRREEHSTGAQQAPGLAAASVPGSLALVAAWEDEGQSFGPGQGGPDVVIQLLPTPILRLPDSELSR